MKKVYNSIAEMVGKTPIFEFSHLKKRLSFKGNIFGKCEFYNPVFSIKDRMALNMVEKALAKYEVDVDTVFVEAADGDTGTAMAAVCAARQIKAIIVTPEDTPAEKIKMIKHFGADVILTPQEDGIKGAVAKAEFLAAKSDKVIVLKQFEDEANRDAHLFYTSTEILADMAGEVDVIVATMETAGTLSGIAQALKTSNPELYVVAVDFLNGNVLNNGKKCLRHVSDTGVGFVPPLYKQELVDEVFDVSDEDARDMAKAIAQTEGLPIGISAGAAMVAAVDLAARDNFKNKNIIVILSDAINICLSEL